MPPAAPPALRPAEEEQDLQTVSGRYAGPLSRLLAFGIDAGLMFALFTMGTAGLDYLLRVFFDTTLGGGGHALVARGRARVGLRLRDRHDDHRRPHAGQGHRRDSGW